jgi:predicted ATPase
MITYIKINGFKSFQDFEMEFTPFTVIAGTNASGKSNLFDALRLLSSLAEADKLQTAFRKEQRGEIYELFTQYDENTYADEMEFCVEMLVNKTIKDAWGGEAILKYTRLRYELKIKRFKTENGMESLAVTHEKLVNLKHQEDRWIKIIPQNIESWRPKVTGGRSPYISKSDINNKPAIIVSQDSEKGNKRMYPLENATRTVLSSFDTIDFRHILAAKEEMKSWRFLQLNTEDLRQPTSKRTGEDTISPSGKNLAASLYRISKEDNYSLVEISRKLNSFLPNFTDVSIVDDTENKQYIIMLRGTDGKEYTSRVLSEGTLRLLTLLVLEQDIKHTGLLCFEEPENGIHPFRIKTMVELLKDLTTDFSDTEMPLRQVIVNTHSPKLIDEVYNKFKHDRNASIQFTRMTNRTIKTNNKKFNLQISRIIPVEMDYELPLFEISEQDKKISITMLSEYLEQKEN